MAKLTFYLVDVFAEEKLTGNQLAVFLNSEGLTKQQMQQIANEMHFSETTFILSDRQRDEGHDVRIFTPFDEVPFAGHPTLGTAYVINHFINPKPADVLKLNLGVGQIPVSFEKDQSDNEVLWMKQKSPMFGKTFNVETFAEILQLEKESFDGRFPIQEVSTGMPFIIVALKTLDAVKNAKVNLPSLQKIAQDIKGGILVFAPQTYNKNNTLNARVFVDLYGIPEDPATGSGNGCLAAYLSRYNYFGTDKVNARVEQGYEVRRPSLLLLKTENKNQTIEVHVGGKVVPVAKGTLL
jgi:trans-2,3-dihydro-3-hydroxyanthranilate isomerase